MVGRRAGSLVPLFSIPSAESWGIGEIADLPIFARWLREAGLSVVQLLPVNEMGAGQTAPASALSAMASDRRAASRRRVEADVPIARWGLAAGAAVIALGAGTLTSDPVTLYDSLVYHVGIMRWLRERGTVPGMALIHNRLGHASAWFALAAPFDAGFSTDRATTIPLGVALVLVAGQGALGVARIVGRRGSGADWFLALSSFALLWPVVVYDAATPSPDVVTNALMVINGLLGYAITVRHRRRRAAG